MSENVVLTEQSDVEVLKFKIRNLVSSIYDIQKVRISVGNRLVANINIQLGQEPSQSQEEMDDKSKSLIAKLRNEYSRITDEYIKNNISIKKIIKEKDEELFLIKSELDYKLIAHYSSLLESEEGMIKSLEKEVKQHPIWINFLADVKGCGALMGGIIISYFDPYKARHVASFWKYAGLDTVCVHKPKAVGMENDKVIYSETETEEFWEGRSKRHTEMQEYRDKDGNIKEKNGITFNPVLKTKLLGVLGGSFLKCKSPYSDIYYDYKNRLKNSPEHSNKTDGHIHNMAMRYMVKMFVRDLWVNWRKIEGLSISEPYEVAYLGRQPHKYNDTQHKLANR